MSSWFDDVALTANTRSNSGMLESEDNELENGDNAGCQRKQQQQQHLIINEARDAQLLITDNVLAMHGNTNLPVGDPVAAVKVKEERCVRK